MNPTTGPTPPSNAHDFASLMARLRAGDETAAREMIENYGHHLLRVVRLRMHDSLRAQFDSRDFVQDVWASFFADLPGPFTFTQPEELIAFLCRVAKNKVADVARQRLMAQKHNVNLERSLNDSQIAEAIGEPFGREPTPSQEAVGRETWEQLLQGQPLVYKRILILLREGKTPLQIHQELGVSERMVRRLIEKLLPSYLP